MYVTWPLFTKRMNVLPKDLMKTRSREIECYNDRTSAAYVPVKFQSD